MVRVMTIVFGMMAAGTAFAGDEPVAPKVVYKAVTEVTFGEVGLEGEMIRPEVKISTERAKAHFPSFIQLRTEWKQEMARSVNDVK